jgi:hypothetical protein
MRGLEAAEQGLVNRNPTPSGGESTSFGLESKSLGGLSTSFASESTSFGGLSTSLQSSTRYDNPSRLQGTPQQKKPSTRGLSTN